MDKQETLNLYTDRMIKEIKESIAKRKSLPNMARSIEDCNNIFGLFDSNLADTIEKLKNLINSKKIYSFKVSLIVNVSSKSKLRRKCCNCPNNPLGYHERNIERSQAERQLLNWLEKAESWVKNGRLELQETQRISKTSNKSNFSRFKTKNLDY